MFCYEVGTTIRAAVDELHNKFSEAGAGKLGMVLHSLPFGPAGSSLNQCACVNREAFPHWLHCRWGVSGPDL